MNDKSDRCISYIYNEMDPSEQVEFERELEQNENLLIEVESLRKVSERLQDIRLMEPPADLLENIYQQASRTHASSRRTVNWWRWGSAAAVLLISVSMSSYMLIPLAETEDTPEGDNDVMMSAPSPQWSMEQEPAGSGPEEERASVTQSQLPASASSADTAAPVPVSASSQAGQAGSPWVDHNDILHFGDRLHTPNASQIDSMKIQSLKKLTPVEHSRERVRMQHRLQLTGSNR